MPLGSRCSHAFSSTKTTLQLNRNHLRLVLLLVIQQYLCCDLTCDFESSVGCPISVLPENCRACYDWGDNLAYDESPIDGDVAFPTPAPTEGAPIVFLTSPPTERVETFSPTSAPTEEIDTFPPTQTSPTQSCSTEEEARCADITAAQQEALDSYDNGGKIIVCDPTCVDGVSDPIHCNCESNFVLCGTSVQP